MSLLSCAVKAEKEIIMEKIEIDWDIHKLIEAERKGFDEPQYVALRRLLKLPPPMPPLPPIVTYDNKAVFRGQKMVCL